MEKKQQTETEVQSAKRKPSFDEVVADAKRRVREQKEQFKQGNSGNKER